MNKLNKKKLNEKKWKCFNSVLNFMLFMIIFKVSELINDNFFNGVFWTGLLVAIVLAFVFSPIEIFIVCVVEKSVFLRKPFEEKE
ncbi:hypothetical protein [Anaerobium acetethylicum]|uniref:Uncharacterized protein n=1 Tax=Anaerobium acetethylicum TaxID=1619234 RepID=A0A1D3TV02_9FIRM|nr:hypothetical protein [Anaerobium acetethylicum]SCP97924.1 hypothetical protein SAMN05421730_10157 [Anaerobium acetethylicum]